MYLSSWEEDVSRFWSRGYRKNAQEILDYLMEIYNNSIIWVNNEWSPVEMRKEYK